MSRILSFGEIIIDINEGRKTVGGAPLNFASHMALLGEESYIYTALGRDENGELALSKLRSDGVKDDYILPSDKQTGTCLISSQSSLGYVISENASYDDIPYVELDKKFDLLYFGTLSSRAAASQNTLSKLLNNEYRVRYFDINIRGDFYTDELINTLLSSCTVYKASREDVGALGYNIGLADLEEYCRGCAEKYPNIEVVIITLDSEGAMLYSKEKDSFIYKSAYPCNFVSSVGAGDSFSACFVHNYLNGKPLDVCLDRACLMGAYVASKEGAVPSYTQELLSKIKAQGN